MGAKNQLLVNVFPMCLHGRRQRGPEKDELCVLTYQRAVQWKGIRIARIPSSNSQHPAPVPSSQHCCPGVGRGLVYNILILRHTFRMYHISCFKVIQTHTWRNNINRLISRKKIDSVHDEWPYKRENKQRWFYWWILPNILGKDDTNTPQLPLEMLLEVTVLTSLSQANIFIVSILGKRA